MNLRALIQNPVVQILTIYILWQVFVLIIYRGLLWAAPSIFSPGPVAFLLPQAIPAIASVSAFGIMVILINRRTFLSFGFNWNGCVIGLLIGFLLGMLGSGGYTAISWLGGWYHIIGINPSYYFWYALLFCFLLAVAEETIFRGYIFQILECRWGTKTALLGSSLCAGLAQVINLNGFERWQTGHLLDWVGRPILSSFVMGLLFSAAFLLTRRMWIPIGLHCAWNTCMTIFFNDPFGIASLYQDIIDLEAYSIRGSAFWLLIVFIVTLTMSLLYIAIKRGNWRTLPIGKLNS